MKLEKGDKKCWRKLTNGCVEADDWERLKRRMGGNYQFWMIDKFELIVEKFQLVEN
jgi:hypothetical protein